MSKVSRIPHEGGRKEFKKISQVLIRMIQILENKQEGRVMLISLSSCAYMEKKEEKRTRLFATGSNIWRRLLTEVRYPWETEIWGRGHVQLKAIHRGITDLCRPAIAAIHFMKIRFIVACYVAHVTHRPSKHLQRTDKKGCCLTSGWHASAKKTWAMLQC